jgi:hypothetical protein
MYMLQPHNWTQSIRPNNYRIAYRRTGAYKGMGQTDNTVNFPWTLTDTGIVPPPPPPCMPTGSMGPLSPGQVWCATDSGIPPTPVGTDPTTTFSYWIQQNPGIVLAAAGALVILLATRR